MRGRTNIRPFIWGADNGQEYHEFDTTEEFVEFFRGRKAIVYAHNGGRFDWHFILDEVTPWTPIMVIAGRLAKFVIGDCEFRDSYNIMPMPLSAVKKDDFDYSILEASERDKPENREKIRAYLRSDCKYLRAMLAAFIDEFGLHLTQAGASVAAWRKIADAKTPETTETFYKEIAPYYYGGRVQCFKMGEVKSKFKIIDINSAYPYAMMSLHPAGDTIWTSDKLPNSEGELQRAFIHLTAASNGAFPKRADDKSLAFPDDGDIREFHVTGWEFIAARDIGLLGEYRVISVKTLPAVIEFSAYLDYFYSMKTDAKRAGFKDGTWFDIAQKARYEFAKRFLNSLYGKMGANPENYSEYTTVPPQHMNAAEVEDGYQFAADWGDHYLVQRPLADDRRKYFNVAIAASITGFVRAYLFRAMRVCGGVLYCDTDCIWAATVGDLDIDSERLGAWDVEAECGYGAIAGKKMYAALTGDGKWKTASKGVRLNARQIIRVARGQTVIYTPLAPSFSLTNGVRIVPRTIRRSATANLKENDHGDEDRDEDNDSPG